MEARRGAHRFCVAPMMGYTDRSMRYLLRLLSRRARLYTEMIPAGALLHGNAGRVLRFDPAEHPVAVQIGGSVPEELARCARRAERAGYDEVNLNVGCPSPRVQRGCFGAALMARPRLVAECVAAMRDAVSVPITIKTRIGIDDLHDYGRFRDFVGVVADAGCETFIVHARMAWLNGLSPRENRTVPPLRYDRVFRLKRDMPHTGIVLNGGIRSIDESMQALARVDGVMLGRAACTNAWMLAEVDRVLFGDRCEPVSADRVVDTYLAFAERHANARLPEIVRPLLGLFHGVPGARRWRRGLSDLMRRADAGPAHLARACATRPVIAPGASQAA